MGKPEVWAAGGVVVDGDARLLVVHRPRYDDWTFPKGKLDPGETLEECALREVEEESGVACELGAAICAITYTDHKGRSKEVRYWAMTPSSGARVPFESNDEVDEIRWLPAAEVADLLSYPRDLDVLRAFLNT